MSRIPYRPEIDGLRAVAVGAVILFHFAPKFLPGGFMGVDVFFVISGYLITSIILASQLKGEPWLGGFWRRRLQRIFPALAVMVILVLIFVLLIGLPSLISNTGKQAFSVSTFLANYRMLAVSGDYWGASADYTVLLHTWSLAVEEQFYFIYPLLLVVTLPNLGAKYTRWLLVILFFTSLFWCTYQTGINKSASFYLLPTRAWELIAGALIAISEEKINRLFSKQVAKILSDIGLFIILICFFYLPSGADFPGLIALVPIVGAVLYILFSYSGGVASNLLSASPAVLIGKASYSLYLWHWPMLVLGLFFAKLYEVEFVRTVGILIGVGLGFASYKWVEPLGRSPRFFNFYAPIGAIILIAASFFSAFGRLDFYPEKFKKDWRGEAYDALVGRETPFIQRAFTGLNKGSIQWHYLRNSDPKSPEMILLGDSHALSLASQLYDLAKKSNTSLAVCAVGGWTLAPTSKLLGSYDSVKKSFYEKRINLIEKIQPKLIIISARWENIKGHEALNEVRRLIERIHSLSPKSKFIIVGQPPVINYAQYSGIYAHEWMNWRSRMQFDDTTFPALTQSSLYDAHKFLKEISSEYDFISFVRVDDLFPITNGRVDAVSGGSLLYYDGDHLSDAGAQRVVSKITPLVRSLLKSEK